MTSAGAVSSTKGSVSKAGRLRRTWRFWVDLTSEKESGDALALFRICIGLVLLGSLLDMARLGLVDALWVDASEGGALHLGHGSWLLAAIGGPTRSNIDALFWIAVGAAILFTLGFAGRMTALVALESYQALYTSNGGVAHSFDVLFTNALWLCVLGDSTRTLSLDCLRRTRRLQSLDSVSAWPRYIGILQIIVVYVTTGLQKLSPAWLPTGGYSALFWVLQDPNWRRFDPHWAASLYPLTQLGTAISWTWEVLSPAMLLVFFYRNTRERKGRLRAWANRIDLRIPYLAIGIIMHCGIIVTMNVGAFSFVAMSFYVMFLRPDEIRSRFTRLTGLTRRLNPGFSSFDRA